jgi:hypothetical protein
LRYENAAVCGVAGVRNSGVIAAVCGGVSWWLEDNLVFARAPIAIAALPFENAFGL